MTTHHDRKFPLSQNHIGRVSHQLRHMVGIHRHRDCPQTVWDATLV